MRVFVINLEDAVGRRAAIEQQLCGLQLDHEFMPAVRGAAIPSHEWGRHYDHVRFERIYGRRIRPGELGCALSHLAVYRAVVEQDLACCLVLEDDAWLNPNLPALLDAIVARYRSDDPVLLLLSGATSVRGAGYDRLWSGYVVSVATVAFGAHAYVVSNAAARRLLDTLYPVRHVAECWTWLYRHAHVRVLALRPTAVTLDLSGESSIATDIPVPQDARSRLAGLSRTLRRRLWRLVDEAQAVKDRALRSLSRQA
jgi:glycosyl transferase family 25